MGCLDENAVVDFIEGSLEESDRAGVESHLAQCADCRRLVARTAESLMPTGSADQAEAPFPAPLRGLAPGDIVGRYRVLHLVGAGAMGVVYAAEDEDLRRKVALKLLRADPSQAPELLRARLMREARAASVVRHPNVVPVHDVIALDDGSPVLVMDLLVGEPLRSKLEREAPLPLQETARILLPVLAALEAAHAIGVVHRDLKPDNIFLSTTDSGELDVKILDFGVAKLTALEGPAARSAGLTATGTMVGTPYYMSPEQAFAEKDIDARADLWALGVILYECLTGRRPTEAENMGQVLKLLAHLALPPIETVAPNIDPRLAALCGRLLCERDRRIGQAAEVRRELTAILQSGDCAPHSPRNVTSLAPPADGLLSTTTGAATTLRRVPSSRKRWPAAFGLSLVIIATAGFVALSSRDPASGSEAESAASAQAPLVSASATVSTPPGSTIAELMPSASAPSAQPKASRSVPSGARQVASAAASTGSVRDAGGDDRWKLMSEPPF